jgi:1-acyl-sn-glycerol-3-phosphate acyltransferase
VSVALSHPRTSQRPASEPVYRTVIGAALAVCKLKGWRLRANGTEHIPRTGPAIIAANHVGYLDFVFLGMAAREQGRLVRFMALREAFDHWLAGPLLRRMHHLPVDRREGGAAALDLAVQVLRSGEVVGIHPEAKLSASLVPRPAKTGAARMALQTGAPLIPAAVWGTQRLMPRGRTPKYPRNIDVTVELGSPIEIDPGTGCEDVTERLMGSIGALLDTAIEEHPQRPSGPDDAWWWPAHLGGTAPNSGEVRT